jgi:hypothetical protein
VPSFYTGASRTGSFWRRHGLSVVLLSLMAVQTALSLYFGHKVWTADPIASFWEWWMYEYQTSLVADVFGAVLLVLLSKRLREVGSAEDSGNDDPEKTDD